MNIREAANHVLHTTEKYDIEHVTMLARYAARFEDDTPVDAEWLERVGFYHNDDYSEFLIPHAFSGEHLFLFMWEASEGTWLANKGDDDTGLCTVITRGHVRKLCDVLGIQLREDG